MAKPIVFIASTAYDLGDMRSALKWWLEELQYEVRASEYPDFPADLSVNSYDACLDALKESDYCIVMIGSRVGGWWNKEDRLTITRKEYRTAYELCKQGKMDVLVFVRDETWTLFQDRRRLETQHDSPCMKAEDTEAIFSFVDEARKAAEMTEAEDSGGPRPVSNWFFTFHGFEDIVAAVRTQFRIDTSLRRQAMDANLLWEFEENLRRMGQKEGGEITFPDDHGDSLPDADVTWDGLRDAADGDRDAVQGLRRTVTLGQGASREIASWVRAVAAERPLSTTMLDAAVRGGEYLEHCGEAGTLVVGRLQEMLLEVRDYIERRQSPGMQACLDHLDLRCSIDDVSEMPVVDYVGLMTAREVHRHIVQLMQRLAKYLLSGDPGHLSAVAPAETPLAELRDQIRRMRPTREEMESWLLQDCRGGTDARRPGPTPPGTGDSPLTQ